MISGLWQNDFSGNLTINSSKITWMIFLRFADNAIFLITCLELFYEPISSSWLHCFKGNYFCGAIQKKNQLQALIKFQDSIWIKFTFPSNR